MGKKSDSSKIKNLTKRDILEAAISQELLSKSRKKRQQNSANSSNSKKKNETIKKLKSLLKKSREGQDKQPPKLKVSVQKTLFFPILWYIYLSFFKAMGLEDQDEEAEDSDGSIASEDIKSDNSEDQDFDVYDIDSEALSESTPIPSDEVSSSSGGEENEIEDAKEKTPNKENQNKNTTNKTSSTSSSSKRKKPSSSSSIITEKSAIQDETLVIPRKRSRQAASKVSTYNVSKLQDIQESQDIPQESVEEDEGEGVGGEGTSDLSKGVQLPLTAKKVTEGLFGTNSNDDTSDLTLEGRETLVPKKFHRTLEEVAKKAEIEMNPGFVERPSQYTPLAVSGVSSFKPGLIDGGVQSDKLRLWLSFTYKEGTAKVNNVLN